MREIGSPVAVNSSVRMGNIQICPNKGTDQRFYKRDWTNTDFLNTKNVN